MGLVYRLGGAPDITIPIGGGAVEGGSADVVIDENGDGKIEQGEDGWISITSSASRPGQAYASYAAMRVPGNYKPGRYTISFSAKSGDGGVVLFDAAAAADVSGEIRPLSDGSICIQRLSSEAEAVSWKTAAYTNGYTHLSLCFGLGALPKNASIQIKDIKIEYDEAYGSPAADGAIGVGVWSAAEPSEKMTGTLDSDGTAKFTFPAAADSDWGSTGKITLPAARPGKIYKVTASVASDKPDIKIGANFRANVTGYIKPGTAWTWMNPSALGDGRIELYTASVFDSGVDVMYPTLEIATGSACTLTVKDVRMTEASPADVDFYIYGEAAGWDFEKFDYAKGTAVLIGKKSRQMQVLMLKKGVKPSWELAGEGMCKLANFSVGAGITMAEEDEDDPGTLSFTSDETTFAAVKLNGVTPEVSKVPVDEAAAMYGIKRAESADGRTVELDLSGWTGSRYVPAVTLKTEPGATYKFSCDIAASGGISLFGHDYTEDNFEMIPIFSRWGSNEPSYETYFSTESKDVFVYVIADESGRIIVSNISLEKQETPLYEVTENADGSYNVVFNYDDEWAEAPLGEISTEAGKVYKVVWDVVGASDNKAFYVMFGGRTMSAVSGNAECSFIAEKDVAKFSCSSSKKCIVKVKYTAVLDDFSDYNWFCYEVDTSKVTDDTINVIFNNGNGDCQTADIKGMQKTGSIHYLWAAATMGDAAVVSQRSDNPDEGLGGEPGKLGVYVFTNSPVCYVYAWGDNTPATDVAGGWPGKLMLKPGEEPPATAVATISVEATGVAAGSKYWFSGLSWDAGWPYGSWGGDPAFATDDDHAKYRATADDSGTAVWSGPFTMEVGKDAATGIEFKFIDIVDANLASGQPTFNPDNIKAEIPAISSDTSLKLVITCKTDDDGMFVEGAKFESAD